MSEKSKDTARGALLAGLAIYTYNYFAHWHAWEFFLALPYVNDGM